MSGSGRLLLAWVVCVGCDRKPAPPPSPPSPAPEQQATPTQPSLLAADGSAATQDEAYGTAVRSLAAEILGDADWLAIAPVSIHDPERDPIEVSRETAGLVQVRLPVSRSRAAAILSNFEVAKPIVTGPDQWREVLYAFLFAHVQAHACERRRVLFGVNCEAGGTEEADAALLELSKGVSVASAFEGGLPLDRDGRALRPPAVLVFWHGLPMAGVPLTARRGDQRLEISPSNASGRATLDADASEAWPGPAEVAVDAKTLLGPLAAAWRGKPLELVGRKVGFERWSLRGSGPAADAFAAALTRRGLAKPIQLSAKAKARLGTSTRQLGALADSMAGRLDVLVSVEATSEFASRMSGSRVWYEAKGTAAAHDVWSREQLARVESSATASGVGDARARAAALRKLGTALADRLARDVGLERPARVSRDHSR